MRILIVEDQKKIASYLQSGLEASGYAVDWSESGPTAEILTADHDYDLILMDVMLPGQSGMDTVRHLRRDGFQGPILMLTALSTTKDKIQGLDAGADDYITKPFSFDELLARVRALLRRSSPHQQQLNHQLQFLDLEMDLTQRKVRRQGQEINLTTKEFALLEYFMRNPERPLTRSQISEHVWNMQFDSDSNVIDVYIKMLRKKIDAPFEKKLLCTVVGTGYALKDNSSELPRKAKDE